MKRLLSMSYQLLLGLQHLHRSGIVHFDVKPANILVSLPTNLKLGDFGLSRLVIEGQPMKFPGGTRAFMSPESLVPGAQCYLYRNVNFPSCASHDAWAAAISTIQVNVINMHIDARAHARAQKRTHAHARIIYLFIHSFMYVLNHLFIYYSCSSLLQLHIDGLQLPMLIINKVMIDTNICHMHYVINVPAFDSLPS